MEWSVYVEARAPEGAELVGTIEEGANRLADGLESVHGVVTWSPTSYAAQVTVEAPMPSLASAHAEKIVRGTAKKVGLPEWMTVRLEAVDGRLRDAELEVSNFPDIVGAGEVLDILDVSKQYFGKLRAEGRFPKPIVELKGTPIWMRAAVEAFNASRRPAGRPKSGWETADPDRMRELARQQEGSDTPAT